MKLRASRLRVALAGALTLAALSAAAPAQAATVPAGFEERTLAAGLDGPTMVDWAADGRMFVIEKEGKLKVVGTRGATPTTVLDMTSRVNSAWDRGLVGFALDRDFATNGFIYLLYTQELRPLTPDTADPSASRLTRIAVDANSKLVPGSEKHLLGTKEGVCGAPAPSSDCIPSERESHSIGTVRSAPDGTLFLGSGDASSFGEVDPQALGTYDEDSFRGKIVHIDRNGRGLAQHPFCAGEADLDKVCTKLYAKGFRNPFRFSIMPDGRLAVGEVGWYTREELNIIGPGGGSYGWPCYEGPSKTEGYRDLAQCQAQYAKEGTASANRPPAYSWDHGDGGASVGGPVYTGESYPAGYRGNLFVADYSQGWIKRLSFDDDGKLRTGQDGDVIATPFATDWSWSVALETSRPDGNLAYLSFGDGSPGTGSVTEIVYAPGNSTPVAKAAATPTAGAAPLTVAFSSAGSSDRDGDPLTYRWDFGDGSATSSQQQPSHRYTAVGTYTAKITVSDGRGKSDTKSVTISVGNTPPNAPVISAPAASTYHDGRPLALSGSANDDTDGALTGGSLKWSVILHHRGHIHGGVSPTGATASFTPITDHDSDARYDIKLTATDSGGLSTSTTKTVTPATAPLRIRSDPAGAALTWSGVPSASPPEWRYDAAVGFNGTVSAPESIVHEGRTLQFAGWSDGAARSHGVTVPEPGMDLLARYAEPEVVAALPPAPSAAPAPTPAETPSATETPVDRRAPRLRVITSRLLSVRGAAVTGRATDGSGIRSVSAALGSGVRGGGCRWWSARTRRLVGRVGSCLRPAWMHATTGSDGRWKIAPWARPPVGSWRLWVRATDRHGNVTTERSRIVVREGPPSTAAVAGHRVGLFCRVPPPPK